MPLTVGSIELPITLRIGEADVELGTFTVTPGVDYRDQLAAALVEAAEQLRTSGGE